MSLGRREEEVGVRRRFRAIGEGRENFWLWGWGWHHVYTKLINGIGHHGTLIKMVVEESCSDLKKKRKKKQREMYLAFT